MIAPEAGAVLGTFSTCSSSASSIMSHDHLLASGEAAAIYFFSLSFGATWQIFPPSSAYMYTYIHEWGQVDHEWLHVHDMCYIYLFVVLIELLAPHPVCGHSPGAFSGGLPDA